MLQAIEVQATNAMILKGISDLEEMLYKQTDIKPDQYLAVIQYLKVYAKPFRQDDTTKLNTEQKQKTIVKSNNFDICTAIEKITRMLYKQTAIKPVVYLILINKMNEYSDMLKKQDDGTLIEQPEITNQTPATKNTPDINLSGIKNLLS